MSRVRFPPPAPVLIRAWFWSLVKGTAIGNSLNPRACRLPPQVRGCCFGSGSSHLALSDPVGFIWPMWRNSVRSGCALLLLCWLAPLLVWPQSASALKHSHNSDLAGEYLEQDGVVRGSRWATERRVLDEEIRSKGLLLCGVTAEPHQGMTYRLRNGDQLWGIECGAEGHLDSVNKHATFWVLTRQGGVRVIERFPGPVPGGALLGPKLPNSSFDSTTGLVTAIFHERPERDCGWKRQWGWTGKAWLLVASWDMPTCAGKNHGQWPLTWQQRPDRR
jgi:Protein of unknown function (DUF1176)